MKQVDVSRLKELIARRYESQAQFADAVNISRQGVQKIFKSKSTKYSTLVRIADFLSVPVDSLFVGAAAVGEPSATYRTKERNLITYVPVAAQAGFFIGYSQENVNYKTFSIPEMPDGKYYAFSVNGDSMSPTIKSGDIVVCSKLSSKEEIKPNAVHVMFDKTDGVVVKRLVVQDAVIRCISDNEKYPEYEMKAHTVKDVYRVRRVITSNI